MSCLPDEFLRLIESYNAPALAELSGALLTDPSVSVRFNPAKGATSLASLEPVPWCPDGAYLPERYPFAFDPLWHQGVYYVQDASSMFVSHVVDSILQRITLNRPVRLLDACAAPGGKTTAAISRLPLDATIVANEYVPARCAVLCENLAKWGYGDAAVTRGDTNRFRSHPEAFDIIIADVPCSGEGMMRKDPEAVAQWSLSLVEQCVKRQREIVDNLWDALAPGGFLIYSTCTFNRLENEEMVQYIVDSYQAESVELHVDPSWGIEAGVNTPHHCYRFIPGRVRGEGLFMALLRKPGTLPRQHDGSASSHGRKGAYKRRGAKGKQPSLDQSMLTVLRSWLNQEAEFHLEDDHIVALPEGSDPLIAKLGGGLRVATIKGRDLVPTQQLAMSRHLRTEGFPTADVDAATAIDYLRCRAITLPNATPRGIILLRYEGRPLGFVKNLGSRANNLYPKPWRILSQDADPFIFPKS